MAFDPEPNDEKLQVYPGETPKDARYRISHYLQRKYDFGGKDAWARACEIVGKPGQASLKDHGPGGRDPIKDSMVKDKDFAPQGKSKPHEAVDWVAEYLLIEDVTAEMAPSRTAWSLLQYARRSPANEADFWKQLWAKRISSKLDVLDSDDDLGGAQLISLIDSVYRMRQKDDS